MTANVLRQGDRGTDVRVLQSALNCIPDGIFGPVTKEAVVDFQKSRGLTPDGIAGPLTISALGIAGPSRCHSSARRIDEVIVHCTDTPAGREVSVDDVRAWHRQRGFSDIGYHYLIGLDGTVRDGRPLSMVGAHCLGHNAHSVGICYVGGRGADGKPADTRTPQQRASIRSLVDHFRSAHGCSVHGHYEFANKACPCFKIENL